MENLNKSPVGNRTKVTLFSVVFPETKMGTSPMG